MPSLLQRLTRRPDPGQTWETLSRVALTLGIFLTPLLVLSWTNDIWETTKAMVLLITVGAAWLCYFLAVLRRREHQWMMSRVDWLVVALWASLGVSALTSVNRWQSFVGVSGSTTEAFPVVTALVGMYFLAGQIFRTTAERQAGWGAMLAGVGLALVGQLFQFADFSLLPPSLPRANTVFSTISNSLTDVAILAALFGSAVLLFWNGTSERWQRWSIAAGVVLSWLVVLLAGRPVGWAVWAIGMIAAVLHQAAKGKKADTRMIIVAVVLAAAGMAAQVFGLHRQAGLANGPDVTLDQTTTRSIVQSVVTTRPVFGTGGTTWYQDFVSERPTSFNETPFWSTRFINASSGWWQALATTGLFGVLLWSATLGLAGWQLWISWTKKPTVVSLGTLGLIAGVVISGFFAAWSLPLLAMLWFSLGLNRATQLESVAKKSQPIRLGFPVAFILATLVIIATWFFAGRIYAAEVMIQQTRVAISRSEKLSTVVSQLEAILRLNKRQSDAAVLLANAYATQAEELLQASDTATATTRIQQAVATVQAAIVNDPKNPAMIEAMNNLLNRLNAYVEDAAAAASRNFATLRQLEPTNPVHDVGYGQTLMIVRARLLAGTPTDEQKTQAQKITDQALGAFDAALKKKRDYPQAMYAKAQALTAIDQPTAAITLLEPLVADYPAVSVFWGELAAAQSKAKLTESAVASFQRAIDLAPTDPTFYLELAQHYVDTGQTDQAKQTLTKGLAASDNDTALQQKLDELNAPAETTQ